jgi:hypothetical protein
MTREKELKELRCREQRKVLAVADRGEEDFWVYYECPACNKRLSEFDEFNYCPYCGQKLDWSVLDD